MAQAHILGYPRIGARRELKWALERYWRGEIPAADLEAVGAELSRRHWILQRDAGLDRVAVGDFSFYDQVLDLSALLGVVPARFGPVTGEVDFDTYFRMARGRGAAGPEAAACELTKWFDTNYHYLVPEFAPDQGFQVSPRRLLAQVAEARSLGLEAKPVLLGPLSYLWLGRPEDTRRDRLELLAPLVAAYRELLHALGGAGVQWLQLDEPILTLELPGAWLNAFESAYHDLQASPVKLLLATYFGSLAENTSTAARLPVAGLHVDLARAPEQLIPVCDWINGHKVLSLGVVDGRNVWRTDLEAVLDSVEPLAAELGDRLWLASSCSLLHCPQDLEAESRLDPVLRSALAFARQKLEELGLLKRALNEGRGAVAGALAAQARALTRLRAGGRPQGPAPEDRQGDRQGRLRTGGERRATPFTRRRQVQARRLGLPLLPTTTIGSFPQGQTLRALRRDRRAGLVDEARYDECLRAEISSAIRRQEALGLDVLVHGEAERSDMVEYFAERLAGFAVTAQGWVQSYGSRCVRPPVIHADVARPRPMTVAWWSYAQSLTRRPVKAMLTGPLTLLQWSYVREDLPREAVCRQLAEALGEEVLDLEAAGAAVIQIDEPALREGLPLRRSRWAAYLAWAAACFRRASARVRDETQIHTHMCYSDFNDIIRAVADLDADVITIETARSQMALLDAFADYRYPNDIGPGVYDIHSPRVPTVEEMAGLLREAARRLPPERLWVNPDCGLKTRDWPEVETALARMVEAARRVREELQVKPEAAAIGCG